LYSSTTRQGLLAAYGIMSKVNQLLLLHCPKIWHIMMSTRNDCLLFKLPFTGCSFNWKPTTKVHIDPQDKGFCCSIVCGEWEKGGELCIIGLNRALKIALKPKDVVVFNSHIYSPTQSKFRQHWSKV